MSAANLVVSSAVAPTTLYASETAWVSWSVANRGTEVADASWSDAVYLSKDSGLDAGDTLLGSPQAAGTSLEPGESYSQDAGFSVPASGSGEYYLLFVADSGGDQAEADEADNVRAVPVTLVGSSISLPDLIITAATAPASADVGNTNVSWTVKNQGTAAVSSFWIDSFYLSTDQVYDPSDTFAYSSYHFNSLAAGASQSFNAPITLPSVPAGSYYLLFVADGSGNVTESDETNNVRAVPITLTVPQVDLIVTAASAPATAATGGTADISWDVKNQGTQAAGATWYDSIYLSTDDTYDSLDRFVNSIYAGDVTPLAPGETYSRDTSITLPSSPAGSYYLLFVADGGHNQAETDETNNVRAVPIALTPLDVHLVVTGSTSPSSASPGAIDISWTVTNQGTDPIGGSWSDYVYLSKDQKYDFSDSYVAYGYRSGSGPLGGGASYTIQQTANLPGLAPGDYYLLFIADQYSAVSETDATNNVRACRSRSWLRRRTWS